MNVYIWFAQSNMTANYHNSAGLVVFAETEDAAREFIKVNREAAKATEKYDADQIKPEVTSQPDFVGDAADLAGMVFVFRDAGCC